MSVATATSSPGIIGDPGAAACAVHRLRQSQSTDQTEFGAQVLDQSGHDVGGDDDPYQQEANCEPALKLAAMLPGSTQAMAATNAGPSSDQAGRARVAYSKTDPDAAATDADRRVPQRAEAPGRVGVGVRRIR